MVKLQLVVKKDGERYFITVPKDLVERKGWKKGQDLYFVFNERGEISIKE